MAKFKKGDVLSGTPSKVRDVYRFQETGGKRDGLPMLGVHFKEGTRDGIIYLTLKETVKLRRLLKIGLDDWRGKSNAEGK